jgi:hypothetical protein
MLAGLSDVTYNWICDDLPGAICDSRAVSKNPNWSVNGYEIDYCLSQLLPPHCKLQFSLTILGVVIAMNLCKCLAMFWTVFGQKSPTLVTVGDALASFLDSPDPLTEGRCLTSKVDIDREGPLRWHLSSPDTRPPAIAYHAPIRHRWFAAASTRRWLISMGLCTLALIAAAVLLGIGVRSFKMNNRGRDPFTSGFGKVDPKSLIDIGLPNSFLGAVLIANLPQAIVSFLYLTYNGLLTSMLLSSEWSRKFCAPLRSPFC